eukprot:gene16115-7465_t
MAFILNSTPVYQHKQACEILLMVQDIFGDINKDEIEKAQSDLAGRCLAKNKVTQSSWYAYNDEGKDEDYDDLIGGNEFYDDYEKLSLSDSDNEWLS